MFRVHPALTAPEEDMARKLAAAGTLALVSILLLDTTPVGAVLSLEMLGMPSPTDVVKLLDLLTQKDSSTSMQVKRGDTVSQDKLLMARMRVKVTRDRSSRNWRGRIGVCSANLLHLSSLYYAWCVELLMNTQVLAGEPVAGRAGREGSSMALIPCEVMEGPRPAFKAVGVDSIEGHTEYLTIEERFLVRRGEAYLLPVRLIGRDRRYHTALIQLPVETDSGANRVWVRGETVGEAPDEAPA